MLVAVSWKRLGWVAMLDRGLTRFPITAGFWPGEACNANTPSPRADTQQLRLCRRIGPTCSLKGVMLAAEMEAKHFMMMAPIDRTAKETPASPVPAIKTNVVTLVKYNVGEIYLKEWLDKTFGTEATYEVCLNAEALSAENLV